MNIVEKKKVIETLSKLINNYEELRVLCNALSNDMNLVIDSISRIIKYAFIKEDFILDYVPLDTLLLEIEKVDNLDERYRMATHKHISLPLIEKKQN